MIIEWFGHSCFKIIEAGYAVVFDPYNPKMIPGLGDYSIHADEVFCSHGHEDHNYVSAVVLSHTKQSSPFVVTRLDAFHDEVHGAKRGVNKLTILKSKNHKIAHLGDLGSMPNAAQMEELMGLDVLMIPVGGHYTINATQAKELVDLVEPKVIVPMHYSGKGFGFPVLSDVFAFTKLFSQDEVAFIPSNRFDTDLDWQKKVVVLQYP